MAQTQDFNSHRASYPYSEDSRMAYSRHYHGEPDPHQRPDSRHSSVSQGDGRAPADSSRYPAPRQPIDEAVTTAFDQAHVNGISPDIIAQITQNITHNVIQQLNKATPDPATKYPPAPTATEVPNSPPSTQSGASPPPARNVYTPPSPQKHGEYSTKFGSPESRTSMPQTDGPTGPTYRAFEERRPSSRLSSNSESGTTRPHITSRPSTQEETTLERIWGPLFDAEGHPTKRLGLFLRGLAVHMIEHYEPKHSLVVTPEKLEKFYNDMSTDDEIYPWSIIFDDEQSSISRMYRELACQHHLVQEAGHLDLKPDIPGLTPLGFETWATMMIQAHPDIEFNRLGKAALALPINNPDDKKERFPKEISRRLFPSNPDLKTRGQLVHAIEHHCRVNIGKSSSAETSRPATTYRAPSPLPSEASFTSDPPYAPSNIERERNPYSTMPTDCAIEDLSGGPTTQPIERERQPYSAAPGGQGRVYEEESSRPPPVDTRLPPDPRMMPATRSPIPPPPAGPPPSVASAGLHRASSTAQSRPINIPPPPPCAARGPPPSQDYIPDSYRGIPMTHRPSVSTRRREPSPNTDWGRRSEPDIRGNSAFAGSYDSRPGMDGYEDEDMRRGYTRRPSPRRYERAETMGPGAGDRRSGYVEPRDVREGEEWYRSRSNTTGGRNW